jgi:transposase
MKESGPSSLERRAPTARRDEDRRATRLTGTTSRARAVGQPAHGLINQIRAFLLERCIAVRQGRLSLRLALPQILATPPDVVSPRMLHIIEDLAGDWRRLDERIQALSDEIEAIARQDIGCERLMSVPGIGPIISSAMVAAIGTGDTFSKGRDFAAWLGPVPYVSYYNNARTHLSLRKDAPFPRSTERTGRITSIPILGGLHYQYCRI